MANIFLDNFTRAANDNVANGWTEQTLINLHPPESIYGGWALVDSIYEGLFDVEGSSYGGKPYEWGDGWQIYSNTLSMQKSVAPWGQEAMVARDIGKQDATSISYSLNSLQCAFLDCYYQSGPSIFSNPGSDGYIFSLFPLSLYTARVEIVRYSVDGGGYDKLAEIPSLAWTAGDTFSFRRFGPTFEVLKNNTVILTATTSGRYTGFQYAGLHSQVTAASSQSVVIDNFSVDDYTGPPPPVAPSISTTVDGPITLVAQAASATGYRFFRNGSLLTSQASGTYVDTPPSSGTYSYTAVAYNASGDSPHSAVATAVYTSAGFTVGITANTGGTLSTAALSGMVAVVSQTFIATPTAGYRILSVTPTADVTVTPAALGQTVATTFTVTAAYAGSVAVAFEQIPLDQGDTVPATPTLAADAVGADVTLVAFSATATEYRFYRGTSLVARQASGTFIDTLPTYGTYAYTAIASNANGDSLTSLEDVVNYAPSAPVGALTYNSGALYDDEHTYDDTDAGEPTLPESLPRPHIMATWEDNIVTLTVDEVVGATGYRYYRDGKLVKKSESRTYTDTAPTLGIVLYTVVAYNISAQSPISNIVSVDVEDLVPVPVVIPKTGTSIYTFPTGGEDVRFAVLLDKLFMSNGVDPIVSWDGNPANQPVVVQDLNAQTPYDIEAPFMTVFRDRLWLAGKSSTVWYCGSSDTTKVGGVETPRPRWQNWSGSLASDGGSLVVGADDGQRVTGLAALNDGLIVFKSRNTYIWTYSDEAIPKTEGAITPLLRGVGCASHDSIAYYNGAVVFLGQTDDGDIRVCMVGGSSSNTLSEKIPAALKRISSTSNTLPRAVIHDSVYYLACDERGASGVRTWVYAYDLLRKCWYEIAGWQVGAFGKSDDGKRLRIGFSDSNMVAEYPLGTADSYGPIKWSLLTRELDGSNPLMDHRWRSVLVDVKAATNEASVTVGVIAEGGGERQTVHQLKGGTGARYNTAGTRYNNGVRYSLEAQAKRLAIPLDNRSKSIQFRVSGEADVATSISRVGAIVRDRKVRG